MRTKANANKVMKNLLRTLSIRRFGRRRSSALPFVLGGIGLTLMGGITALFAFSPRTRDRTLSAAKDAYGKVEHGVKNVGERVRKAAPLNGLIGERSGAASPT